MRILHVVASLAGEWGGPPRMVAALSEALIRTGVECVIAAPDFPRGGHVIRPAGVAVRLYPTGLFSRWWKGYSPGLGRELKKTVPEFDLVHIHELWHYPLYAAARAAVLAERPYIVTIHGSLEPWALGYKMLRKSLYWRLLQSRILAQASVLHALTKTEADQVNHQGLRTPVAVIPNGVANNGFSQLPRREVFEGFYPNLAGKQMILFSSRFHPKKGLDILSEAFIALAQKPAWEDVRLVVAGPDECGLQPKLQARFEVAGIADRVIYPGMLEGRIKLAALSRADIFVLPSRSEGFSLSILEAMACRLPVVITHACHFPEVRAAGAGIVIDAEVDQLIQVLEHLLTSPRLRRDMGERGRQLVVDHYTWETIVNRIRSLYESIVSAGRARARCRGEWCSSVINRERA